MNMWWWIKCRRAHVLMPSALICYLLVVVTMQGQTVSLPSILSGTSSRFLLALIAPIPLCATLVESLESRVSSQEETGLRNVPLLDAGLSLASTGVAVVSAL